MYKINPNILQTSITDGKILLLEPSKGQYYELNETSVLIYQGIAEGLSHEKILTNLIDQYEINPNGAKNDMLSLFDCLIKNNVILHI